MKQPTRDDLVREDEPHCPSSPASLQAKCSLRESKKTTDDADLLLKCGAEGQLT
ncbi:hypothetical protein RKD33_003851 [Streptomyces sp. SAI-129]